MKPSLIVSFTSYPARIHAVPQVLESLYAQSMKPDRILLWLAEEQFANHETDLPKALIDDAATGKFELRWCDDLGSHKKYFYSMQEFPDDIIVTVDDDMYYDTDMIRRLYESYQRYSKAISANCVSLMLFDTDGNLLPCSRWILPFKKICGKPSMQLMAIGSRGILYPPHSCDLRAFDKLTIKKYCSVNGVLFNNDSWLKVHEILANIPVVYAGGETDKSKFVANTQEICLRHFCYGKISLVDKETEIWHLLCDFYGGENGLSQQLAKIAADASSIKEDEGKVLYIESKPFTYLLWRCATGELPMEYMPKLPLDFDELKGCVYYHLALCNQFMANDDLDVAKKQIKFLQDMLRLTPEIQTWAEHSQIVEIRAILDHGAVLKTNLWGDFRHAKDYLQMAQNWREFLVAHPRCDERYFDGYERFLKDMNGAIAEMEQNGASAEELAKCQSVLEADWALWHRPESKYIRLKKWFYNSRYGHVLSKVKRKIIQMWNQDAQI